MHVKFKSLGVGEIFVWQHDEYVKLDETLARQYPEGKLAVFAPDLLVELPCTT